MLLQFALCAWCDDSQKWDHDLVFFFPPVSGLDDSTPGKGTALVGYDDTCFPPASHVNQILQKQKNK